MLSLDELCDLTAGTVIYNAGTYGVSKERYVGFSTLIGSEDIWIHTTGGGFRISPTKDTCIFLDKQDALRKAEDLFIRYYQEKTLELEEEILNYKKLIINRKDHIYSSDTTPDLSEKRIDEIKDEDKNLYGYVDINIKL